MASASSKRRILTLPYNLVPFNRNELILDASSKNTLILRKPDGTSLNLEINDCIFVMRYNINTNSESKSLEINALLPTIFKINSFTEKLILCYEWDQNRFSTDIEPLFGMHNGIGQKYIIDYNSIIKLPKNEDIMPAHVGGKRKNKNKTMRKK